MMRFETFLFFLIFSFGLVRPELGHAQGYIDIDLSPPTKKTPPKQQATPTTPPKKPPPKAVTPAPAKKIPAKPTPKQAAPKPPPQTPSQTVKPSVAKALPKVNKKPLKKPPQPEKELTLDAPVNATPKISAPVPSVPAKATTPPLPVAKPTEPAPVAKPAAPEPTPIPQIEAPIAAPTAESSKRLDLDPFEEEAKNFRNRHAFSVDYTTWYETLKIKSKSSNSMLEGNSHYFGVAINYDFTYYREKWGAAISIGSVTGNAQAGTKDSGDYYERRIAWTGFRGGGRLFYRANNRIDLGLGFMAQSKNTKWPEEEDFSVIPQANPHYFYYLDTRWRINYRYEIVQSFGAHLRSYALAWLLGISYTLN